ncbi:MAG TPA: DUF1302 domain-containing protein [Aromatoleum sp.]|uniref:DUF1302 domain-containing protein n=1 Tax=Aromatoleum sp. TaxID=2307007 RepID=UPI002B471645|nr:DUF1302 domain-containing protein [Aromatoleum sp.]HJV26995.1 DUF1302 domain-containing protein [Aromatoleum sp.]
METRKKGLQLARRKSALAVAAAILAMGGNAQAFEFDTGNADLQVRWDNTVRYNVATRVEKRDDKIGNSAVSDEGTYSFDRGDLVANRLDLLSELDVIYKGMTGFRVSGAGWYDDAYGDESQSNPNAPFNSIPSYRNHEYSHYTKRLYHGPSGELLDAFVFGNFDAGDVPVRLKAGRHTVFWGESLFLNGALNSVSYSQMPLDLQKGFATPGVEAKELFRPLNQVSGQAQVTDTLSVAAQYFLDWEAYRYPEGGTYLGPVDFAFNGPDRQFIPRLGFAANGKPVEPKHDGEYGLALRWSPEVLDGTLGFYYRRYADKLPQILLTRVGAGVSRYNLIYAGDIDLYGVSLAKNIAGISVGAEFSYRRNTPLNAQVLGISPTGLPDRGETTGPRGDTYHGLVNFLGVISKTPVFDAANWAAEVTWARWDKVRSGKNLFYAEGFVPCRGRDKWDGCTTRDFWGLSLSFTPTWYQVLPGVDLSAPVSASVGLSGNAPTVFGGNEGNGNYSVGLSADVFQKYRIDLKYIDYFGRYRDNGTAVTTQNGFTTLLKDRGFVSLTLKTTF